MIVESLNFRLKLEEFLKEESYTSLINETERTVKRLASEWSSNSEHFSFITSGSTGQPKNISISREKLDYSIESTFKAIDPEREIRSALMCINPSFIGGAMVVFRALKMNLDLYIIEPTRNINEALPSNYKADLVSLVPMQFDTMNEDTIARFKNILVGGGPVGPRKNSNHQSSIYSTYGMTETVSHVALRKIDEELFRTTGDTEVSLADDGCLQFKGRITDNKLLKTNDLGSIISSTCFQWIGRKDFIINSGGIKLNPEEIEKKIRLANDVDFIISSLPDKTLGEKVVLVINEKPKEGIDFSALNKYEKPKAIYDNVKIERTANNKIDRIKTRENLLNSYG